MTTAKTYDKLNRLTGMTSTPSGGGQLPFSYGASYNEANQRITVTMNDGSYWVYEYDTLGQITSAKKHFADGTFVPGQQFTYSHSNIGNRTGTTVGGTETGGSSGSSIYHTLTNTVNQYVRKYGVPGYNILGTAHPGSNVVVNGSSVNYRRGEYFWKWMSVTSSTSPQWLTNKVVSGSETNSGSIFIPGRPEYFTYDLDGNMLSDGRWNYTWDAENRLISMTVNTNVGPQQRIVFEYDYQGRRIAKKVWNNTAGTGTPATYLKYLYDGWNLIAELNGNSGNSLVGSYTWGLDLSGTAQGAGGVGGLLMVNAGTNAVHFPAYDLNGNVMGLVNAANGNISAKYEYGPFGEVFCSVGDMARVNPFQFSTKYTDNETDLVYYGYRYYSPALGRWMSRDPIEEKGGLNLYAFVNNDPVNAYDTLGLWKEDKKTRKKRRRTYIQESGDTREDLARIVGLDVGEFKDWAKQEEKSDNAGCACSVPNIWISADLMRKGDAWERFRNLGGTIGQFVGTDLFTHGFHVIKPGTVPGLINTLIDSDHDLWGMVVFAHGDPSGEYLTTPTPYDKESGYRVGLDAVSQRTLINLVGNKGYKISIVRMMQCYSARSDGTEGKQKDAANWREEWEKVSIHFTGYERLNVLGIDTVIFQ